MIVLTHKKPGPGYKWVEDLLFAPDGTTLLAGGQIGGHIWYGLPASIEPAIFLQFSGSTDCGLLPVANWSYAR